MELKRRLRASEETLQGLIEASLQGVLIVTNEYEPLLANQTCARIFGFESPAEIMALDSIADLIASPALARVDAIETESRDGSETTEIHEFDGVRKDGSIVRLKSMAKPIDWQGRWAVVLTLLEITGHEKAEAALSGREAQLRAIMDNAPAEIYLKDGDGRYLRINRHYEDLWGVKDEEVRGKLPGDIHSLESFAEESRAHDLAVLQSERAIEQEQVVLLDSSVHTLHMIKFPVRDADGKVTGLGAIATDVTERKKAEEELKKSEERFRDFSELGSDWLWEMDENLRFKYMSPDIVQLGVEIEAFIGNTLEEARHDNCDLGDLDEEMQALNARKAYRLERPSISTPGRWLHISGKPLFSENGTFQGYRGATTNITERKRAETALQKARDELESRVEERTRELSRANRVLEREIAERRRTQDSYKTLLETAPDPIVTVNQKGKIVVINAQTERVFGYGRAELIGQSVELLLPERFRGRHVRHRNDYFGNPQVRPMGAGLELVARCKDGRELPVEISLSPVQTTEGSFVTAVIRDVTERRKAELALRDHKESLRRLLETTSAIPWEADAKTWKFTYVGPQAVALLGHPRERWLEKDFWVDHIHPEDRAWAVDYCLNSSNRDENYAFEYRMIAADGRSVWLHDIVNVVRQDGALVALRGFMIDITERKQAEEALRVSEARLKAIFDNAPTTISLKEKSERYLVVNRKFAEFYGIGEDEVKGKLPHEIFCADLAKSTEDHDRAVLDAGRPIEREEEILRENSIQNLLTIKFPIRDDRNQITGIGSISTDITERKQAEEAQRESEERYRELFDESPVAIWVEDWSPIKQMLDDLARGGVKDWRGYFNSHRDQLKTAYALAKILEISHATIELYRKESKEHMLRMSAAAVVIDEELDAFREMVLSFLAGQMTVDIESKDTAGDGSDIIVRRRMVVPPKYRDDWSRVIYAIEDITERKQAEESLRGLSARLITAQEEERSRIARELHDDFNQRLALLAVDLERLHDGSVDSQECLADGLESLLRRTKELSSDVHRLSHQLHPSVLQHLGLVAAIRSFCKETSNQHAIHIELVHHGVPRSLPGDVALCLYRIVQEALRNVIKHSGADSARVELSGTAEELTLQISDDGTGFDLESARTRGGLGLLSMRERLRLVSGTISFERVEPTGTRIEVRVPLPDSDQQIASIQTGGRIAKMPDDNEPNLEIC